MMADPNQESLPPAAAPRFPSRLLLFWTARCLPAWLLIGVMIFIFQLAVCAIVHDNRNVQALINFLRVLPTFIQNMLGGAGLMGGDVSALISIGYVHPFVLTLFMIYGVAVPTGLLVGEVQNGAMELILSRPVKKSHVYLCAAFPACFGMVLLTQFMFLGTVVGTSIFDFEQTIPLEEFFRLSVNGALLALVVTCLAMLISACSRERPRAVGISAALVIWDYFMNMLSAWWPPMAKFYDWSLFHYVDAAAIFEEHRWPVSEMATLLVLAVGFAAIGWVIWRRRDLPA